MSPQCVIVWFARGPSPCAPTRATAPSVFPPAAGLTPASGARPGPVRAHCGGSLTFKGLFSVPLLAGGLRGCDPRDRHAVRRAAHVVEARDVEEGDRRGIAPVLAADAELQVRLGLAPSPRAEPDQPAHARLVDGLERAAVDDLGLHVAVQEAALHVVAREAERRLREVVRPE